MADKMHNNTHCCDQNNTTSQSFSIAYKIGDRVKWFCGNLRKIDFNPTSLAPISDQIDPTHRTLS